VADEMRGRGDDVTVIGPLRRGADEPRSRGFGGVVNIPANGAANRIAILTPPWTVRRFFRSRSFDLVHVHEPLVPLLPYYALWFSPRAAHVCTFHMYAEHEPRSSQVARTLLGRATFPSYQRAIAVSRSAGSYAERAWKRDLAVIPNGVSTKTFVPGDRRARIPTAGDPLRLLFVGRWDDRRKGLRCLLEAHARLRARGLPVTLDVVGEGVHGKLGRPPGVTFHGVVPSTAALAEHYRSCDIFVSPALGQESFGIVLLEAMASGRPVVCSGIAGYRHVVDPRGVRMVPPGDAEALAQAIFTLARDPGARHAMGELNRARAEGYDWHDVADKIRAQYVEAIGDRHGLAAARTHEQAVAERHWGGTAAQAPLLQTRS
jgi:phosphatidylinositol alpha-mannosyltransferase